MVLSKALGTTLENHHTLPERRAWRKILILTIRFISACCEQSVYFSFLHCRRNCLFFDAGQRARTTVLNDGCLVPLVQAFIRTSIMLVLDESADSDPAAVEKQVSHMNHLSCKLLAPVFVSVFQSMTADDIRDHFMKHGSVAAIFDNIKENTNMEFRCNDFQLMVKRACM